MDLQFKKNITTNDDFMRIYNYKLYRINYF